MKRRLPLRLRVLHAVVVACALWLPAAAPAGEQLSRAETLLFETDHLHGIEQPLSLHYDFQKRGSLEPEFGDSVEIKVGPQAPDGSRPVATRYLSGPRQVNFPPVSSARGNPVLMYFLERDIREMQRLTGGHWRYFQRHIRLALADKAQVRATSFVHERKTMRGQEIRLAPYADDPQQGRYAQFARKYYVFVLSQQIPGGIYQIRAVTPAADGDAAANLMEEVLTFSTTR